MSANIMEKTSQNYYRNRRISISELIDLGPHRILDVGCGAGNFGAFLKQNGQASEVVGLEIDHKASEEARTKLDQVFCTDLNRATIAELFAADSIKLFDYIVCADVLEHLIDPWKVLRDLASILAPGGKIVVSIPNVRHWSVWLPLLLNGQWNYLDAGIMDRTHLRFFTRSTIQELFTTAELDVIEVRPLIGGNWRLVDKYSLHLLRDFVAVQWVFVGVGKSNN